MKSCTSTRLFHRYRDRYQALLPVPGSVTGPEPIPGCHGYRNRNQALSPELVPDRYQALSPVPRPVPGSFTGTRLCHQSGTDTRLSRVPEPEPGSVTGTGTGTRTRLCHRNWYRYYTLPPVLERLPEPVKWKYGHDFCTSLPLY